MCYDISNIKTYESIERKWKTMLDRRSILENKTIIIVGLKEDLPAKLDRTLIKMINKYCEEEVACSCKSNQGIQEVRYHFIRIYL
jgi:GTPase SAR1 family protein